MNRIIAKTAITALLLCAAALIACQKPALLTLSSPTNVELSPDGGNGTITFKANRDWTVRAADNWVRINPSSGTASDGLITVTLTADVNTTYEDRSTTVTVSMEGMTQQVTVKQPANTGLIVSKESVELSAEATTIEVEVQANIQFNVSVDADWIAQAGTKALTATKLSFSVARNDSYNPRSATITISGGGLAKQVSVKQKGLESQDDPEKTQQQSESEQQQDAGRSDFPDLPFIARAEKLCRQNAVSGGKSDGRSQCQENQRSRSSDRSQRVFSGIIADDHRVGGIV